MKETDEQIVKCVEFALKHSHQVLLWRLAELFNIRASFESKMEEINKFDYEEEN